MSSTTHPRHAHTPYAIFATALALALAACGGPDERTGPGGGARTGYTSCSGTQCAPGQYCDTGLFCVNGCVSDLNCLPDARCVNVSSVSGAGICEAATTSPNPTPVTPPARDASCDGYAAHARECGMLASEAEALRQSCDQLDADSKRALVACNAAESCAELLSCSGVECFTDAQCPPASPRCLGRAQVVDPFNDVPYTCR